MQNAIPPAAVDVLTDALPEDEVHEWLADEPAETNDLIADRERYRAFWQRAERLIDMMPEKSARPAAQEQAAEAIWARARESRDRFLRAHARAIYGAVTHRMARFVRVEELLFAAADAFPGLVPKRAQIAAEKDTLQRDKDGLEIDQGILISHVLAHDQSGRHLCHAMLLPRPESQEALAKLATDGALDLGAVRLERHGRQDKQIEYSEIGHYAGYNLVGRTEVNPMPADPNFNSTGRYWLFGLYPILSPQEIRGGGLIRWRYADPKRGDDIWSLSSGSRRLRRLNESIMRMNPSKGASSEARAKSACSSCAGVPPLRVLAKNELSLNGSLMMWLQASTRGG